MSEFAIAEVMPGKLNALVKNIMRQTGQADPNEAVRLVNSGEWVLSQAPLKSILHLRWEVQVGPLTSVFKRREFFKTRPGLYLWNDMERVLSATTDTEPNSSAGSLKAGQLVQDAYDREIKAVLPEHHEVELWQIAELIERQKNGGDGVLLNNGYANIFYVAGFAVRVHWDAGYREWYVSVWKLDDVQWGRGRRVFSSN